jgi:hypothetical protein
MGLHYATERGLGGPAQETSPMEVSGSAPNFVKVTSASREISGNPDAVGP